MRFIKSTVIFYVIYLVLDFIWNTLAPLPQPADDLSFDAIERMLYLTVIVTVVMMLGSLVKFLAKPRRRHPADKAL